MITFKQKGDWSKTDAFLEKCLNIVQLGRLDYYGRLGVDVLKANTPKDTGKTSESWDYEIVRDDKSTKIYWTNDNLNTSNVPIAIILQYGHATENGSYVEGIDFINPALRPIFNEIAEEAWREVTK